MAALAEVTMRRYSIAMSSSIKVDKAVSYNSTFKYHIILYAEWLLPRQNIDHMLNNKEIT